MKDEKLTDLQKMKLEKLIFEKTLESYEYLLSDPKGRRFLAQLGLRNYMQDSTFEANSRTFYHEGRRSVVLELYSDIRSISRKAEESLLLAEAEYRREYRELMDKAKGAENEEI